MNMVIINTSKLRVALKMTADKKKYNSITAMLNDNGLNSSIIAKTENRFSQYADKINFEVDNYVRYGAIYEDIWKQVVEVTGISKEDFELEQIELVAKGSVGVRELDVRVNKLEETVLNLMKIVEELNKTVKRV